jgi:hypothetical protein
MAFLSIMARFGLDASGFKAGIKQAQSATKGLSNSLKADLKGAIAGAFGTAAITASAKSIMDYAGKITDLSDRLGMGTDVLQEFDFAARMTGTNLETFTGFLEKLAVSRESALEGNEEMIASFAALGVSLSDLRTKNIDELTRQIGNAVQSGDVQSLAPSLKRVGGASASALIPAFRTGLDELGQQGRESGAIISKEDLEAMDEASDKFDYLVSILRSSLVPVITLVIEAVTALINGFRRAAAFWGGLFGGGMEAGQQALQEFDADTERQQAARQNARAARENAQRNRPAQPNESLLEKLREQNRQKEERALPDAERRAKIEERIAKLRNELTEAEVIAAATGTEEAQIEVEKLKGKILDAEASLPQKDEPQEQDLAEPSLDKRPTDPMVNALERIGFSFGKSAEKTSDRHLESIAKGVKATNDKLDKIEKATTFTANAYT